MEHASRSIGGTVVLQPKGRVELTNADGLRDVLLKAVDQAKEAVILDLHGLDYVSSAGLRSLMIASKQAKARGVTIGVAAMQPVVKEIFTISRFNLVFATFDTVREAMAKLAPAALAAYDSGTA
jgi:anti-sigma B factor antagonist/stage II sporulation protein AA (anti-sigma F factor antagonist)